MTVEEILEFLSENRIMFTGEALKYLLGEDDFNERIEKEMKFIREKRKKEIKDWKEEGYTEKSIENELYKDSSVRGLRIEKNSSGNYAFNFGPFHTMDDMENYWSDISLEEIPVEDLVAASKIAIDEIISSFPAPEYRKILNGIKSELPKSRNK